MRVLLLAAVWCALIAGSVVAQGVRPSGAQRVVRLFDFEERAITTEPVPQHWVRIVHQPGQVERPGFPAWNESGFDGEEPYRGDYSVRLPTRGGSAALRLAAGVIPVAPRADYTVRAAVRTRGLRHARARLAARFLDADLKQIESSQQRSELIRTGGAWEEVRVELWGDYPQAAWVQVDLLLLQPTEQEADAFGAAAGAGDEADAVPGARARDDLSGAAWFDDVAIVQAPRLELSTNSPTNVIDHPQRPTLRVRVRDLTGETLRGVVRVHDLDGELVTWKSLELPPASPVVEWTPPLGRYGWYRATLDAVSLGEDGDRKLVGRTDLSFVWASRGAADPADAPRLMAVVEGEPLEHLEEMPAMAGALGVGAVQVEIPDGPADRVLGTLERAVLSALESRFRVALEIGRVSSGLARRLHLATDDVLALPVEAESDAWTGFLEPALARFGQRVRHWQLGRVGDDHSAYQRFVERRAGFREAFERLSPEPVIATPWPAHARVDEEIAAGGSLTITLPRSAPAESAADYAETWRRAAPGSDVTLVIAPPEGVDSHRARQLAWRTLHAWGSGVDRLAYASLWKWSGDRRPEALPGPEFAAVRALSDRLHGKRVIGEMPMPEGAHALILRGVEGSVLAVWNEYAAPGEAVLEALFGEDLDGADGVRAIDLYGNPVALERTGGRHRLEARADPVFVENVDPELLLFQAGARIDPSFVTSEGARRELELVLENPWPDTVTGQVRMTGPEHWRLAPRTQQVVIEPGREARLPFEVSLGVGEEAGVHAVAVDARLNVGRELLLLPLSPEIEIGIEDLSLEGGVRLVERTPGEPADVVVVAIVTNVGSTPATMTLSALAPGLPRKQAPVSSLQPGDVAVRQFRFPRSADLLSGKVVRLTLSETEGFERLNRTLEVP